MTYEEQQAALRAQVPKGTAGAEELGRQGFTDVGTQPIDTAQPAPKSEGLTKVATQGVGPGGEKIYDVFAGQEHIADPNDPRLKDVDIAGLPEGQAPGGFQSKFSQGFQDANKALGEKALDVSGEQGISLVQKYAPAKQNDLASAFVQTDPFIGNLVTAWQEYIKPENQRVSLADTYKSMVKDSGLQALDMDIINARNIIEGTEEDIRREITGVGSMATESQVRALANARNRVLIKDYNTLLATRDAKEKYLQTALQLEAQDRQSADQRFENQFQMGLQIADYQQKMKKNAVESLDRTINAVGWSGLANIVTPYEASLIESAYGLPQNGLLQAAQREMQVKAQAEQERQLALQEKQIGIQLKQADLAGKPLEVALKQEQIKTEQAQRAKIFNDMKESTGKKLTTAQSTALGFGSRLVQSGNIINDIGDQFASKPAFDPKVFGISLRPGFTKSAEQKQFEQAKRNFVNAVLRRESGAAISPEEFESAEKQYFPLFGDDAGTLANKEANRTLVTRNFLTEGGLDDVDPTKLTLSPTGELIELID